jgi:hypothetical protein
LLLQLDEKGKITPEALAAAHELQKKVFKQQHPRKVFDEAMLVSRDQLESQLKEAEELLQTRYGVKPEDAPLPARKYVVGDFYRNDSVSSSSFGSILFATGMLKKKKKGCVQVGYLNGYKDMHMSL